MDFLFRQGEVRSAIWISCKGFNAAGAEKTPKQGYFKCMIDMYKPQSFELGLLRPGLRRAGLTVLAPRRPTLLAGTQNPGVQTIPFNLDTL